MVALHIYLPAPHPQIDPLHV